MLGYQAKFQSQPLRISKRSELSLCRISISLRLDDGIKYALSGMVF